MSLIIAGMGTAVPPHRASQEDASEFARLMCPDAGERLRVIPALYRRSGVETRHSVLLQSSNGPIIDRQEFYALPTDHADRGPTTRERMNCYEAEAAPLAVTAARAALQDAKIPPEAITHLVTVSCSGFSAPGVDLELITQLGLSCSTARTHIGFMGCHAALNGLRVARAFIEADPCACVLLCAVELCSLHQHYGWHPDKIVSNSLFGDGAAAVICSSGPALTSAPSIHETGADSIRGSVWRLVANGSWLIENSADAMTWRIGNNGFEMTLSPRVPDLIQRSLRPWLEQWLSGHRLSIPAIASWAVHPGGPRILGAFAEAAGLPGDAVTVSQRFLAEYGNMSSPTVLFILKWLRANGAARPCVALGFGPGLAVEAALFY